MGGGRSQVTWRPLVSDGSAILYVGDMRAALVDLPECSVDSVVCDPPYELGFMGKKWDSTGIAFDPETWRAVLRVLKPGGHLIAFGGTRTYHRIACAIEDAGFEVRDSLHWIYGTGFPKSLSVHKAALAAIFRAYEAIRLDDSGTGAVRSDARRIAGKDPRSARELCAQEENLQGDPIVQIDPGTRDRVVRELRKGDTPEKPSASEVEAFVLRSLVCRCGSEETRLRDTQVRTRVEEPQGRDPESRSPLSCLRDDSDEGPARAPSEALPFRGDESLRQSCGTLRQLSPQDRVGNDSSAGLCTDRSVTKRGIPEDLCRGLREVARTRGCCGLVDAAWLASLSLLGTALKPGHEPAILARKPTVGTVAENVLAHGTGALNIAACRIPNAEGAVFRAPQSDPANRQGVSLTPGGGETADRMQQAQRESTERLALLGRWPANVLFDEDAAEGLQESARAFYYVAKPSRKERDLGCEHLPPKSAGEMTDREEGSDGLNSPRAGAGRTSGGRNTHPTVKPVEIMRYLIRLVTPPGGIVLDPFTGSGTTGMAAALEGFSFIGAELLPEHAAIAAHRIQAAHRLAREGK